MTYCVYTAQRARSFWCALSVLIAVCVLSPAHLEHCSRYTSVHTCFGCVLRRRFVPRTWFDHVPAGTVLAGTILFRTRSDYKKWCVPVHICSRYTTPAKCSRNMFSVHEHSYYEHCEMFSVPIRSGWKWHASRSAQYDVLCIHCATCEVILMCTLRADSGLRAKPRPLRTLFSVHERSYLFWMCTKGAICSENMVWPCSSWNCSSGNNSL